MNRGTTGLLITFRRIPHTRGDEPVDGETLQAAICVFPTRVGMNRFHTPLRADPYCIPHTRGDEPRYI